MIELTLSTPTGKPPLGGWLPPVSFSETQAAVLNAVADQLIPGGDGFPAPSQADVLSFIARYLAPSGQEAKWYPFLGEDDFRSHLDALGEEFLRLSFQEQVETLQALERDEAEFFTKLRDVVYHAYYSRPEVVRAINDNLAAGKDYRQTPQPFGYSDTIIDWDDELLARVRGSYKRTQDVVGVELPPTLAGPGEKAKRGGISAETEVAETAADETRLLETGAP
jgi:hypothetical protein